MATPTVATGNYKVHPLVMLFPAMNDKDFAELKQSIRDKGQQEPIILLDDVVIDGRHRLKACEDLGIAPKLKRLDYSQPGQPEG